MTEKETYGIIGSTGELEMYHDAFANISEDDVDSIKTFEQYIHEQENTIGGSFLKIGAALLEVEKNKLYKAAGASSMAIWMGSAKFNMSYEHGTRLMRIVRDLVPILGTENLPPVSTLKEMLPMVTEGATPEDIKGAAREVSELTIKDAKVRLRELRGVDEKKRSVLFKGIVTPGESFNRIRVTRVGGDDADTYDVGTLRVKPKDWPVWADRFGGIIEYE